MLDMLEYSGRKGPSDEVTEECTNALFQGEGGGPYH